MTEKTIYFNNPNVLKKPTPLCVVKDCNHDGVIRPDKPMFYSYPKERFDGFIMCDKHSNEYNDETIDDIEIDDSKVYIWENVLSQHSNIDRCCVKGCVHEFSILIFESDRLLGAVCNFHGPNFKDCNLDQKRVEKYKECLTQIDNFLDANL